MDVRSELRDTVQALVQAGKGILAADESGPTIAKRFKAIGVVDGRLFTAVFTLRGDLPRFISVRRSNKGEERAYHSAG